MAAQALEDARRGVAGLLLPLFFLVFSLLIAVGVVAAFFRFAFFFIFFLVIIVVDEVAIFSGLAFIFLVVLFVRIIGDEVQVDGMRLRDFEFGFALGATQDLAFFDFVFLHIN